MGAMASQITSLTIVYLTVYLGPDERKQQSSASLAFVWGIHRWPVNSPHKWPVSQKCLHLMTSSCDEVGKPGTFTGHANNYYQPATHMAGSLIIFLCRCMWVSECAFWLGSSFHVLMLNSSITLRCRFPRYLTTRTISIITDAKME